MKRTLVLLVACGLLASTALIVRRATDEPPKRFCTLGAIISTRGVEIDGRLFAIGLAGEDAELERGCYHYGRPVIQPNCVAWDEPVAGKPNRLGRVGPFYTDGTCDGSRGGTRLDDAPVLIERPSGLGRER